MSNNIPNENEVTKEYNSDKKSKKLDSKVIVMPSNIVINENDPYNTEPINSLTFEAGKNYKIFSKGMLSSSIKSKIFWIFMIILPMIFTFIEFTIAAQLNKPSVIGPDLINQFMITPLLLLTLVIFPAFIIQSREDNLLKRYALVGMSRKQIYYNYMLFSILFIASYLLIFMGAWVFIMDKIVASMLDNGGLENGPWSVFSRVQKWQFTIIYLFALLGMLSLGFEKGMNAKSSKSLMNWGIGMWIFAAITQGTTGLFSVDLYSFYSKNQLIPSSVFGTYIVVTLLLVLKWMFLLTLPTIISVGMALSSGTFNITDWSIAIDANTVKYILESLAIVVSYAFWFKLFINKNKVINFEASR